MLEERFRVAVYFNTETEREVRSAPVFLLCRRTEGVKNESECTLRDGCGNYYFILPSHWLGGGNS